MSGYYDETQNMIEVYKGALKAMVFQANRMMWTMKLSLQEEGRAVELKNKARMVPMDLIDQMVDEHKQTHERATYDPTGVTHDTAGNRVVHQEAEFDLDGEGGGNYKLKG